MWTFATMWESGGKGRSIPLFSLALAGGPAFEVLVGVLLFGFVGFPDEHALAATGRPSGREEARAWAAGAGETRLKGVLGSALVRLRPSTSCPRWVSPRICWRSWDRARLRLVLRRLLMPSLDGSVGPLALCGGLGEIHVHLGADLTPMGCRFYFPVLFS